MIEKMKANIYKHEEKQADHEVSSFYNVVHEIIHYRWSKSCTILHCLTHSLNLMYFLSIC